MELSHKKIIGWKEDGKVRRRLYKFWGGHRRLEYVKTSVRTSAR